MAEEILLQGKALGLVQTLWPIIDYMAFIWGELFSLCLFIYKIKRVG